MLRALRLVKAIVNARPEIVRFLFKKYGIDAEPTELALVLALQSQGDQFKIDLANLVSGKTTITMNADGDTPVTPSATDTSWLDTLSGYIADLGKIVSGGTAIWGQVSGAIDANTTSDAEYNLEVLKLQYSQEAAAKQQQTIIIAVAGIALVVIVLAVIMLKRK
jgi:hypothetical protein